MSETFQELSPKNRSTNTWKNATIRLDNVMKLRWFFVLSFLVGLVLSAALSLQGGPTSAGWLAAAIISIFGLAWTVWGDGTPTRQQTGEVAPLIAPPPVLAAPPRADQTQTSADRLFEVYFERAPVPLVVFNRDGHIERMNLAAEAVTEFAAAEVRSQPYWNIFLAEVDASVAAREYRDVMLQKEAPPRRETWRTRMGSQAQFEWWRNVLKDDFGLASGVLAAALPVADEHHFNMSALTDQLTAVNGYSEWLLMSMDKEDPIRTDLESIHRAGVAASEGIRTSR